MVNEIKKNGFLDGVTIKIFAAFSMLIDHIGYVFYFYLPSENVSQMRIFGRLAFPIFAFMLVQGFIHTKNRLNYLARLLGCGFFLIIALQILNRTMGTQTPTVLNIFITLGLGFITIWGIEEYHETSKFLSVAFTLIMIIFAEIIHADYGAYGIITIVIFYIFRNNKTWYSILFALITVFWVALDMYYISNSSPIQIFAIFALPLLWLYNGKQGKYTLKYFFYIFYPAHLFFLMILRNILYGV